MERIKNIYGVLRSVMMMIALGCVFMENDNDFGMPAEFASHADLMGKNDIDELNPGIKVEMPGEDSGSGSKSEEQIQDDIKAEEERIAAGGELTDAQKREKVLADAAKKKSEGRRQEAGKEQSEEQKKIDEDKAKEEADKKTKEESAVEYKIGDKVLTTDELKIVRDKMVEKLGEEFIDGLEDDKLQVLTKEYINILEASKAINKRNREDSEKRASLAEEETKIQAKRDDLKKEQDRAHNVIQELEKKKAELERVLAEKPKDEFDDDEVFDLKMKKGRAKEKIEEIDENTTKIKAGIDGLKEAEQNVYLYSLLNEIQRDIPDLYTDEPALDIVAKAGAGEYKLDDTGVTDEKEKEEIRGNLAKVRLAERVKYVFNAYLAVKAKNPDSKLTVKDYYKIISPNLPKLEGSSAQSERKTLKEIKAGMLKETFSKLKEKQIADPRLPGSGKGTGHSTERFETGTDASEDDYWNKLGYASLNKLT